MFKTLKKIYWKIKNILGQIFILLLIGYGIYWVGKNLESLSHLINLTWVRFVYFFCVFLYLLLFASTISSFVNSNMLQIYNPSDSKSLAILNKKNKYHWLRGKPTKQRSIEFYKNYLVKFLESKNYERLSQTKGSSIFEKTVPFFNWRFKRKKHRVFMVYRSLFNVLIVDRILSETEKYIQMRPNSLISQNIIIILTDMKNEEEILSAGTGIVNYLSSVKTAYLYPVFIDASHGHIFYPQDNSLLPWYKKFAMFIKLKQLKSFLNSIDSDKT